MSKYVYNDGGRSDAGYTGHTGDCVVRAIALATGRKYKTVYRWMQKDKRQWYESQGLSSASVTRYSNPGKGVSTGHYAPYLRVAGWYRERSHMGEWCVGDTVADIANKYKGETVIVRSRSKRQRGGHHLCCIKRGTVLDTWDCRDNEVQSVFRKRPKR